MKSAVASACLGGLLLAACAGAGGKVAAPGPQLPARADELFPAPAHDLVFPAAEGAPADVPALLEAFCASTGWALIDRVGSEALQRIELDAGPPRTIPAREVYRYVETQLAEHDLVLSIASARPPRMLVLREYSDRTAWRVLGDAPCVDEAELEMWRQHPAHAIRVALQFDDPAVMEVGVELRRSMSDGAMRRVLVVESSRLVLLAGPAPWVAEQRDLLRALRPVSPAPATPR